MKRIFVFAFASLAIFASCSKAEIDATDNGGQTDINVTLTDGQILCAIPPQTKTALDGDLNVIWTDKDEIMVLGEGNQVAKYAFSSFATDDKKAAIFENVDPKVTGTRTAIYPASAYVADSYNGETAKINLGGVEKLSMPVGAVASVISSSTGVSALPLVSTPSDETLSFDNLFGGIMFRPYDYMGMGVLISKLSVASTDGKAIGGVATINVETGEVTSFEGTDTELTYTCSATDITSKKGFVAYLPAGNYPGLVITAIDNMGRKFPVTTQPITINAGVVKKLPELPLTIWYGTTNCYVVAPGAKSVEIDATPYYSWRSDYDVTKGNVIRVENGNMSGLGGGATVLWQQEENSTATDLKTTNTTTGTIINGTIKVNRKLSEGKTDVTVPLTGAKGNAVIALRSVLEGTPIVWSFHIWVSEVNDIACSTAKGSYSILDRNIGATNCVGKDQDASGYPNSFGLFYQWGRKDPFPHCLSTDLGNASNTYHYKSNLLNAARRQDITNNIAYTIQNPDTRITESGKDRLNWLQSVNNALWGYGTACGGSTAAYAVNLSSTVKTVYDPCPQGYRVPPAGYLHYIGTVSGNATGNSVNTNFGIYLKTGSGDNKTFIPQCGVLRSRGFVGTGSESEYSLSYPKHRGYVWSSIPRNTDQGCYLFWFNNSAINKATTDYLNGFCETTAQAIPVRCIKE